MASANKGFLYRRLAQFAPCVLPGIGKGGLSLGSKYDVASVRDVFLSAHYWRLFEYLTEEPQLIVDLGAHCGHFSVLCHLLLEEKFSRDTADYHLVEPVEALIARARENLSDAGILSQTQIHQGLVGRKTGHGNLRCNPRNLLASSVTAEPQGKDGGQSAKVPFLDLDQLLPANKPVDVLKVDIEGSESQLLLEYPELLRRTRVLMIELHGEESRLSQLREQINKLGLRPVSTPIRRASEVMCVYLNDSVRFQPMI